MHSIPEWESETQSVNPKWLEHHHSGHLTKDPSCPVCMEEAGSKINHRRKYADRHPGIMHCDLIVWLQQSPLKLTMCRSCYPFSSQCRRRMQCVLRMR